MKRMADFRKKHAEVLKGICPENEKRALLETRVLNVLVDRDQHRRRILIMNIGSKLKLLYSFSSYLYLAN